MSVTLQNPHITKTVTLAQPNPNDLVFCTLTCLSPYKTLTSPKRRAFDFHLFGDLFSEFEALVRQRADSCSFCATVLDTQLIL